MNLLSDPWVPVDDNGRTRLITFKEILCEEHDHRIALPRDDLELACLQLLICLTQVLFMPEDARTLKQCARSPLTSDKYEDGVANYIDWFDLRHPETPFMQIRGVQAKEPTPIQKLFVGLPAGNNHAFFNKPSEINTISESSAAIALFNQAMNAPNISGKHKGSLRGGAPITTLMSGKTLRQTLWINVLHKENILNLLPDYEQLRKKKLDKPVWVEPIQAGSTIPAQRIGLVRGLFWQPMALELVASRQSGVCDVMNISSDYLICGFNNTTPFTYTVEGTWNHPHSPRQHDLEKGTFRYLSFNTTAPAWTLLDHLLVESENDREGYKPAEVIRQFKRDLSQSNLLIVGGYRNKQASILQRRHENFPLRPGWQNGDTVLKEYVSTALHIKQSLKRSVWILGKESGISHEKPRRKQRRFLPDEDNWFGLHDEAEALYYRQSEPLIHQTLREIDWNDSVHPITRLRDDLIKLSWEIFDQVTRPYAHEPKMIQALAVAKKTLGDAFRKLKGAQA